MAGHLLFRERANIHSTRFIPLVPISPGGMADFIEDSYGQTITYREIARQLAVKQGTSYMSAQAVGGAVGHNEVSIIIPCHRGVGSNGSLTGYAGGIEKKVALLKLEHTDMSHFFHSKERNGTVSSR